MLLTSLLRYLLPSVNSSKFGSAVLSCCYASLLFAAFALQGCRNCTTTRSIDHTTVDLPYGGNTLYVEQLEVRTSSGHALQTVDRTITYSYIFRVHLKRPSGVLTLFAVECTKDDDVDDFAEKLQVKQSPKLDHLIVGLDNRVKSVSHSFRGHAFATFPELGYEDFPSRTHYGSSFKNTKLSKLEKPRDLFEQVLEGKKEYNGLTADAVIDILMELPPGNRFNIRAAELLFDDQSRIFFNSQDRAAYIERMQPDQFWRNHALNLLRREVQDLPESNSDLELFYQIGGKDIVRELDEKALKSATEKAIAYYSLRMENTVVPVSSGDKKRFNKVIEKNLLDICQGDSDGAYPTITKLQATNKQILDDYLKALEQSPCFADEISDITSDLLFFDSNFKKQERQQIVTVIVRNFKRVPKGQMYGLYGNMEDDLSCEQKRELLTKYKQWVDIFDDKKMPECK